MKTYLFNTIDRIKQYSQKLDATTILCQKAWYVLNEDMQQEVLIFRQDGSVIVSSQGETKKYTWEYLQQNNSVLINHTDIDGTMLKPAFMCEEILALRKDGTNECMFLIDNESDKMQKVRSIEAVNQYFAQVETQIEKEKQQKAIEEQKKSEITGEHRQTIIQRVQQEFSRSEEFQNIQRKKGLENLLTFIMIIVLFGGFAAFIIGASQQYGILLIGIIIMAGSLAWLIGYPRFLDKKIKDEINEWFSKQYPNCKEGNGWSIDGENIDIETVLESWINLSATLAEP